MQEDLLVCSQNLLVEFQPREAIRSRDAAAVTPHVGVIGAGLAGLRCAEVLIEGGAKVTLLEARDRVGGRVSSVKVQAELGHLQLTWTYVS